MKAEKRTRIRTRIVALLLMALIVAAAASCAGNSSPGASTDAQTSATENTDNTTDQPGQEGGSDVIVPAPVIDRDREGNLITLPDKIETIISMGPSNTEVLVELGFGDTIIATDEYSGNIAGLTPGIPKFSMMAPDGEQIINLLPDVIFVTGMSRVAADDPYKLVSDAGICVIYMPSSTSLEAIKEDIRYMGAVLGAQDRGEEIVAGMEREIDTIRAISETISETITDKRTVYFEVAAAPHMVSFGVDTFLHEMIELVGAVNAFENHVTWISVADEVILATDPDVILTSVNYIDDPIGEIKSRPGWSGMTAVRNDAIYYISTDASNRPSHNVVKALWEIARAVYPEFY